MRETLRNYAAMGAAKGRKIVFVEGLEDGSPSVTLRFEDGSCLDFDHRQDCCEHVRLYDCEGTDVADYVGAVVHEVHEVEGGPEPDAHESYESFTWTFYRIITSRGTIVLRFLGESNGYYSERVDVTLTLSRSTVPSGDDKELPPVRVRDRSEGIGGE